VPPDDPATVFTFYDGFAGSAVDTSVWTVHDTVSVTGGKLVCGGGTNGDNGIVTTTLAFPADSAIDYIATATSTTAHEPSARDDQRPALERSVNSAGLVRDGSRAPRRESAADGHGRQCASALMGARELGRAV
jgi:hypothetical protein